MIYSIAVVDRRLDGDLDGNDVMRVLKEKYPQRPIICASCFPQGVLYADAKIQKPFSIPTLDQLIRKLMSKKS